MEELKALLREALHEDHTLLVEMRTEFRGFNKAHTDEMKAVREIFRDHEERIRANEKVLWRWVGGLGVLTSMLAVGKFAMDALKH